MKWVIGLIIIIAAATAVLIFGPRKEHVLAPSQEASMQELNITSSAFERQGRMPEQYTCDSPAEVSPPLTISGVPANARTLALIMHDPDAPRAGGWTHWVKWNIPWNMKHGTLKIEEGEEPAGTAGKGTGGEATYQGPCPPSGTHRYIFSIYALDTELSLKVGATKTELESAMQGRILAQGELIGLYSRKP